MINRDVFGQWFDKEVQARWKTLNLSWLEMGDWHWRLRDFDLETLTQAIRQHKTCECYPTPNLKKVYEYARTIQSRNRPQRTGTDDSGIPEAHTFIMCIDKDERGRGKVGWFIPIQLWPFKTPWTPEDYQRVASEQARKYADFYGGDWQVFTHTNQLEMLQCAAQLRGNRPIDLNQRPKQYQNRSLTECAL